MAIITVMSTITAVMSTAAVMPATTTVTAATAMPTAAAVRKPTTTVMAGLDPAISPLQAHRDSHRRHIIGTIATTWQSAHRWLHKCIHTVPPRLPYRDASRTNR